jgi:hypothetical protein
MPTVVGGSQIATGDSLTACQFHGVRRAVSLLVTIPLFYAQDTAYQYVTIPARLRLLHTLKESRIVR